LCKRSFGTGLRLPVSLEILYKVAQPAADLFNSYWFQIIFYLKKKEVFMIARLTFIGIHQEDAEELKKIYNEEVLPVIRNQKGNLGAWLLEPADEKDDFISLTEWVSQNNADAYESGGTYKTLVEKVKGKLRMKSDPVLKIYSAAENKIMTSA
jgi:quinol monooxygenase YgiN